VVDSLFPFIDATIADAQVATKATIPKEYAWDFINNKFILENGRPVIFEGLEAIKVWILKALRIERFRYLAYTWDYGQEFDTLVGQKFGNEVTKSEVERFLKEELLINPHITNIADVSVTFDESLLGVSFTVITDQGEAQISVL
jgi:hypothetical protein